MPKRTPKALGKVKLSDEVLQTWAAHVPADMKSEPPRDKILDSFLRLFESLTAANLTRLPPRSQLFQSLSRAIHWQWTALDIQAAPIANALAPHILTLAAMRWCQVWQADKTPGRSRLMAAIDRDLDRINAAVQYVLRVRKD